MRGPKRKGKPELRTMSQLIQGAMKAKGLTPATLTEAMGLKKGQRGAVVNWMIGVNGPGEQMRPKLAEVLGLSEDQLTAPNTRSTNPSGRSKLGPAQRAVALVQTAVHNGELLPAPPPVTDVFSIRARSDGNMIVKLEANLPFAKGAQLVQFLMSFGLAPGAEEPS